MLMPLSIQPSIKPLVKIIKFFFIKAIEGMPTHLPVSFDAQKHLRINLHIYALYFPRTRVLSNTGMQRHLLQWLSRWPYSAKVCTCTRCSLNPSLTHLPTWPHSTFHMTRVFYKQPPMKQVVCFFAQALLFPLPLIDSLAHTC